VEVFRLRLFVAHATNDPRFDQEPLFNADKDDIGVPGLWVAQAYDVGVQPEFAAFEHARANLRTQRFALINSQS